MLSLIASFGLTRLLLGLACFWHHRHTQDQNAAEARHAAVLGYLTMAAVSAAAAVAGLSGGMGLEHPLALTSGAICGAASLALGATAALSLLRS